MILKETFLWLYLKDLVNVFQNTEYSVFPVTRWLGNSHLIKI